MFAALARMSAAIMVGDELEAEKTAREALKSGKPYEIIVALGTVAAELGRRLEKGEFFLPELIGGAEAMNAVIDVVVPIMESSGEELIGKIVIGSVQGDIHDIGKKIVAAMLAGAGFKVIDLGVDVPTSEFMEKIKEENPDIIAASAYITTTTTMLGEIGETLEKNGLRERVKYLIGGASVSRNMVEMFGANGFGENAADAVREAKRLIKELRGGFSDGYQ